MPIYDFRCRDGHVTERREDYEISAIPCPKCDRVAERVPINLDQYIITETGAKPSRRAEVPRDEKRYDIGLFQEACMERDYDHKRAEEIAQKPLASENLWAKAKKRADAVKKGLAPPPEDTLRKN